MVLKWRVVHLYLISQNHVLRLKKEKRRRILFLRSLKLLFLKGQYLWGVHQKCCHPRYTPSPPIRKYIVVPRTQWASHSQSLRIFSNDIITVDSSQIVWLPDERLEHSPQSAEWRRGLETGKHFVAIRCRRVIVDVLLLVHCSVHHLFSNIVPPSSYSRVKTQTFKCSGFQINSIAFKIDTYVT